MSELKDVQEPKESAVPESAHPHCHGCHCCCKKTQPSYKKPFLLAGVFILGLGIGSCFGHSHGHEWEGYGYEGEYRMHEAYNGTKGYSNPQEDAQKEVHITVQQPQGKQTQDIPSPSTPDDGQTAKEEK